MYPDQSLYPADIVPAVVRRINNTFIRADQIHHAEGKDGIDWFAPIVAEGYYRVITASSRRFRAASPMRLTPT